MIRRLTTLIAVLLVAAVPAVACVPEGAAQNPAGPDLNLASKVISGLEDVNGRPTTIPGSMGGAIDIGDRGAADAGVAGTDAGGTLTGTVNFTGGSGIVSKGTVTDAPGGGKVITVDPAGISRFDEGRFTTDNEGKTINPATAPGVGTFKGGKIDLGPGVTVTVDTVNGTITISNGNGKITGQTEGKVDGGTQSNPNATAGVTVDDGKPRYDSNQVYGED